jgi:chromosome segregation protein
MKITRLRLLGFKSFVEPTDLVIEAGLTGVVGPNGCGKSNLLEALRWVMGESSYKSMRASAMDDVIFSGTSDRPSRNSAEVTIFIDNSARQAPAEFNGSDEIEITRRIEREAGSAYRINGKESRARDIKILFEDASTGARSPALVRQGQISEIVNAKPEQRRRILEDAAGIAGLHSRRHEAELRLRAAENNLARLHDLLGQLKSQIESLKRQARQARRYKEVSSEIRKVEALQMHLAWADAQDAVAGEERHLTEAMAALAKATELESAAVLEEARHAEELPPLREAEAARAAVVARLNIERENLDREAERLSERQQELAQRQVQLQKDIEREDASIVESKDVIERLDKEIADTTAKIEAADDVEAEANQRLQSLQTELATAEKSLAALSEKFADAKSRRRSLEAMRDDRRDQVEKLQRQLAALEDQTRTIGLHAPDAAKLTATQNLGNTLAQQLVEIESQAIAAEERAANAAANAKERREAAAQAKLKASALKTERETLSKLVSPSNDGTWSPIVDQISVDSGFEAALGAALGDDLDAPTSTEAPVHWALRETNNGDAKLPMDVEPLLHHVKAPPHLTRRLKQIGLVSRQQGDQLQAHLKPGQRLVSREGDLWRWDGFVAAAEGVTPAAQRLSERNRLQQLAADEAAALEEADLFRDAELHATEAHTQAERDEKSLRQRSRQTQAELAAARDALSAIERTARETDSKLSAVAGARASGEEELQRTIKRLEDLEARLRQETEAQELEPQVAVALKDVASHRDEVAIARDQVAGLAEQRKMRRERLETAANETERWKARQANASEQIVILKERHQETSKELDSLSDLPAKIGEKHNALLTELQKAETQRHDAADKLAAAENTLRDARNALKAKQNDVAEGRESRARTEARLEAARNRRQDEARRIREAFDFSPENCLQLAECDPEAALPPLSEIEHKLAKMRGDRERLGGVNLQADDELTTLSEQYASMETECDDVEQAVNKLRGAIQKLNREGAKRLAEAFETVNRHFSDLFTTLFGGGEARLEMIEGDDPLGGGLEIIAKPPGKKPVTLSLLSGGEQTLTALSLIFAVFLTNPAPICVLDEVDAPLDDANVDRFCTLMEKMAADTATRFLVITHHPMTMTRMNRLFGVTMAEKGVSQLVSVDLETAQQFRDAG